MKQLLLKLLNPVEYHLPRWRWRIMKMHVSFPDGIIWFGKVIFLWDDEGKWKHTPQIPLFRKGENTRYQRWLNGIDRATN